MEQPQICARAPLQCCRLSSGNEWESIRASEGDGKKRTPLHLHCKLPIIFIFFWQTSVERKFLCPNIYITKISMLTLLCCFSCLFLTWQSTGTDGLFNEECRKLLLFQIYVCKIQLKKWLALTEPTFQAPTCCIFNLKTRVKVVKWKQTESILKTNDVKNVFSNNNLKCE